MKRHKQIVIGTLLSGFALMLTISANAQCENWNNSPKKDEITDAHVIYRGMIKQKDFDGAYEYWKKAYDLAPAADGNFPFHYTDGAKIFVHKFKNETDAAKKKEYAEMVLKLHDQSAECFPKKAGDALSLKAYDMYYSLQSPYPQLLEVLEQAVEKGGNSTPYTVFRPYAAATVWEFQKERMDKETARNIYQKLNEIADHNIANNATLGKTYEGEKEAVRIAFAPIEWDIFDCDYFKNKLEPDYRKDPDNWEKIKEIYNILAAQGCDPADPLVVELKAKYDVLVTTENAKRLEEFYKENPGKHARALYDEEKFDEAIAKYKEAIEKAAADPESTTPEDLSAFHFEMASIQFRKQKKYGMARDNARKAAKLRPNWGRPYMLIADMYAATSNSCGKEAWDKQIAVLAAIDKYAYAKSIDPEVSEEANKKIGKYSGFKPDQEEGFMRKVSAGQTVKVGCWIGETVKVRFK